MYNTKFRNSIISLLFLLLIIVFGVATVLKCAPNIGKIIEEHGLLHSKSEIESELQGNFKSKYNWINIYGLFLRVSGMTYIIEFDGYNINKLDNGQLASPPGRGDVESNARSLRDLDELSKKCDAEFVYVQFPHKVISDDLVPAGVHSYANENADDLLFSLRNKDVDYLDIRENIKKSGSSIVCVGD